MTHLMSDNRRDATVIHGQVGPRIEKWWLQYAGRENNFIERRIVIGIHCLWRHAPLFPVGGLAQPTYLVLIIKLAHVLGIGEQVISGNFDGRKIAPLVGVGNLGPERLQLLVGLRFGGRTHPVYLLDALRQRRPQVFHQCFHLLLGGFREVAVNIDLAQGFAEAVE